jgi:hypothetical protein
MSIFFLSNFNQLFFVDMMKIKILWHLENICNVGRSETSKDSSLHSEWHHFVMLSGEKHVKILRCRMMSLVILSGVKYLRILRCTQNDGNWSCWAKAKHLKLPFLCLKWRKPYLDLSRIIPFLIHHRRVRFFNFLLSCLSMIPL